MKFFFFTIKSLLILLLITINYVDDVVSTCLYLNSSGIKIVGLFPDKLKSNETTLSIHSNAMFRSAILLSQQYNITFNGEYLQWQSVETGGDTLISFSGTCEALLAANVVGIVGPGLSKEVDFIDRYAKTIGVPVISYSATAPDLSSRYAYPAFYRTVPSDDMAAVAIVKLFFRFNWTSCVIIYQNDAFGLGGAKAIRDAFTDNGLFVRDTIVFYPSTRKIKGNLQTILRSSATRIVIVWADTIYTSVILEIALQLNVVGPKFTWVLSSSISLNSFQTAFKENLIGILTMEPVTGSVVEEPINKTLLNEAYRVWQLHEPISFPGASNVDYYALFAFDATWTLIKSLENMCSPTKTNRSNCLSFLRSSLCLDYRFLESISLFDEMNSIRFLGVSGLIQFSTNTTNRINGSYYYVRNVQAIGNDIDFVPVLQYDDADGWSLYRLKSVIVWPGNSLILPTGRATLEDVTLRIVVIELSPFTMMTYITDNLGRNKTKFVGYMPDLIEELRTRMKFIPDIQLAPSNKTYSDLIDDVANGVYDMFVGDVTITSTRKEFVGFSDAIFDNSLRIVARRTSTLGVNLLSFLNPFSRQLWTLVLCALIYSGVLFWLLERKQNESLQNRSILSQLIMSWWYSFGNVVGYGVEFNAVTAAGRLLTSGLYILSLVLVASYTANLASDLTTLKSKDIISGMDDIKRGKIPFNRIGIYVDTAIEDFYLREVSGGIKNYYPLRFSHEVFESLLSSVTDIIFMDAGTAEYVTNNIYCNLTLIGVDVEKSSFGIVIPKEWLYTQDLDIAILSLRESGVLDFLRQKWFQTKYCSDATETISSMAIESMSGLFLIFGIISIFSVSLYFGKQINICGRRRFRVNSTYKTESA